MTENKLSRILGEEERAKEFISLVKQNDKLVEYFVEILESYSKELGSVTTLKDLSNPQWAVRRAYRDGGEYYLKTILKLFKEK